MKIAIVHDWITGLRGGERCLQAFLKIYPTADIFTLIHVPGSTDTVIDARVKRKSFLDDLPGVKRYYRYLLPLYPAAVKSFRFEGYDLVISLSHAVAKNITVPDGVRHVCFCFTPMRYIWDQARSYFGPLSPVLWPLIKAFRTWDRKGARRVSCMVGISRFVSARIRCFYRMRSEVIYPPVDTSWITPADDGKRGEAFLYAGALVPYKRPDLVVKAFNRLGEKLWVVGSGPEEKRLKAIAGDNIEFKGRVTDSELAQYYRDCRALIFPGREDFGLVPVECLAAGRPVIGLYEGGLKETLNGLKSWEYGGFNLFSSNGVFFRDDTGDDVSSLTDAVYYFMAREDQFMASSCVKRAQLFSPERFYRAWDGLCEKFSLLKMQDRVSSVAYERRVPEERKRAAGA